MVLNDALLAAISWTLIHSVWQGFLLALVAGLLIQLTKKSTAALRYNCLAVLFVGFLVVAGFTFNYEFHDEKFEAITRINLPIAIGNTMMAANAAEPLDVSMRVIDFLNRNPNIIALLWFGIFCVKCFGVFTGMRHVYRIRNYKTQPVSAYWTGKMSELAERLGLKPITLLESRLVNVPSVTGFFKPMILIPVGLLSQLPHDQIEAILLHELAHIRRKDYGMNLLQRLAETLFFFNPGLLWVSALLKDERENCCDDMAIAITRDKSKFINALVSFEEYQISANALTMGFGSNKKHLLNRAKRIVYSNNKSLDAIEKTFLSMGVVLIAVIVLACSKTVDGDAAVKTIADAQIAKDIAAFKIDSLNAIKADALAKIEDSKAAIADSLTAIEDSKVAIEDSKAAIEDSKASAIDALQKEIDSKPIAPERSRQITRTVTSKTRTDNTSETTYAKTESKGKSVSLRTGITGEDLPENLDTDDITNQLLSDLISANIVSSTKNLSYKLSGKSLIVNGVVQPESSFRKLRDKYLKSKFIAICYNYEVADIADMGK